MTFKEYFLNESDKNLDLKRDIIKLGYDGLKKMSVKNLKELAKQLDWTGFSSADKQEMLGRFEIQIRKWKGINGKYDDYATLPEYKNKEKI